MVAFIEERTLRVIYRFLNSVVHRVNVSRVIKHTVFVGMLYKSVIYIGKRSIAVSQRKGNKGE